MSETIATPTHLALYEHHLCGFCQSVRRATSDLGLTLESRNILNNPDRRQELIEGGGKGMVPCLRIETADGEVQWLYESRDIVAYLEEVAANQSPS
ncbi:MAG: glutathione S-transferase N-terminal domain-containing protein [Spiribacter sp.]|jgi:Glutathione S-transferase|nr:glutathione S-transferase N-terminal domain-containing protein [Spiribacter sp.]MDR9480130.1 glutathione S-transferase N-terminal domain-containing protein [Spiribacter sp.]